MSLAVGTRLGPYEILAPIGAGGMGEVYKAKDTRLDRMVAVKVLPEHLAESPERKSRFEREAKAISQLNHPHICTLHDVGEEDGVGYLVMECIEGQTLADKLKKGPLPIDEALKITIQIAAALDKAHRAGVIHRDLKPANIMLTKSGVKLLDFGLAKVLVKGPLSETSEAPTRQKELTGDRSLLGTLHYMAPEQLEGADVDARTDIFALGAVLYEAITGQKAFTGGSAASLIGAILRDEPEPPSRLQPLVPAPLDRFVSKCLAKDPDDRWQTARDLETELAWLASSRGGLERAPVKAGVSRASMIWMAVVAAIVVAWIGLVRDRPVPLVTKMTIQLPVGDILTRRGLMPLAISPDGRRIAYTARRTSGGGTQLYVRELDRFDPMPIAGSENASSPFFSPDGESVGFFHPGENVIKRARLATGHVVPICRLPGARVRMPGAHWQRDGTILFAARGLWQVPDSGGTPELLSSFEDQAVGSPQGISEGRRVLLTVGDVSAPTVVLLSLDTGEHTPVVEGAQARYVPSGHLVYADDGALWGVAFDVEAAALAGPPVRLVDNVDRLNTVAGYSFALSDTGTLVYAGGEVGSELVWVDRAGDERPNMPVEAGYHTVRISPDGRSAVADDQVGGSIWVHDLERGIRTLVARAPTASMPIWHPSGDTVAYSVGPGARVKRADGSGEPETILERGNPRSYSPDGRTLAFDSQLDIWLRNSDGEVKPFLRTEAFEQAPVFSPDGRYLAYISDVTGRKEIYVEPYPGPGERLLVSTHGGTEPVWSPLGDELFYRESAAMMAVPIELGETIEVGRAERLFEGPYQLDNRGHANFDVTPDGERFLMLRRDAGQLEMRVIVNWLEELKARAPVED